MTAAAKDHYEVLGIPLDADASDIKKAHRKLALKWHPDKNPDNKEQAAETFQFIQQAYECLSDPAERKWYDEHRDAILRGWSANGGGAGDDTVQFIFDVIPFMHPGCYSGYGDDAGGFFRVYQEVFTKIYQSEQDGWVSEGNIEEMPLAGLPIDFGIGESDWSVVGTFYTCWESFSSCRAFAWADKYDAKDADHRRMRRAMDTENKKARKVAKREFNDSILALVHFVKRRDPRVKTHREQMELEKEAKRESDKLEALRKKELAKEAREEWLLQAEERMAQTEQEDLAAGRIRLADLEDDYDFGRGKRGKKGKKNRRQEEYYLEDESDAYAKRAEEVGDGDAETMEGDDSDAQQIHDNIPVEGQGTINQERTAEGDKAEDQESDEGYESSSEEEDEEPDLWRCECCRKDFKSAGQMENHMKSKKHKEQFKKWQKKQKETPMDDLLSELALEP